MNTIPDKMKALSFEAYNANLIRALRMLKLVEKPVPVPAAGQVLVKMDAAPVNPSDIAFLRGGYSVRKQLPATPGFEGTGTIVRTGDEVDDKLKGSRVCFFSQDDEGGSWAEYVAVNLQHCMPVSDVLPVEQAACLFINPLTAYGLMDHILENQHEAMIQSAAMGQVGEFVRFFASDRQVKVINLVRKEAHVKALHDQGEYALDISFDDFPDTLHRLAIDLNATAAIDAVGGELTGKIFNAMPAGSEVIVYGGLSGTPVSQIDTLELIFKNKILSGFNLGGWLQEISREEFGKVSKYLELLFLEKKLQTDIQASIPLSDFYEGIRKYISAMSDGKVLFRM
ncbi:MAG: alcohol dehydrogenase catalytic domain-containing protein [Bacteroidales bacterium]